MARTSSTSVGRFYSENSRQEKQQNGGKTSHNELKKRAEGFQVARTQQWKNQYKEENTIHEKRAALFSFFVAQQQLKQKL